MMHEIKKYTYRYSIKRFKIKKKKTRNRSSLTRIITRERVKIFAIRRIGLTHICFESRRDTKSRVMSSLFRFLLPRNRHFFFDSVFAIGKMNYIRCLLAKLRLFQRRYVSKIAYRSSQKWKINCIFDSIHCLDELDKWKYRINIICNLSQIIYISRLL